MSSPAICPTCGKPLPLGAPQGLCPRCLLRAAVPSTNPTSAGGARSFIPPSPEELGALFPQLEILELIGQGGMGAVYRARQPNLDRLVALKILSPQPGDDPGFTERFTREARALARLNHANIVAVHDFGQAGKLYYLLMEFVDGASLRHLLVAGKINPAEALAIVPPICESLQYAHDRGIIHRDIKPENILLGKNGVVKIADFGLAKIIESDGADFSLTGARDVMGTPYYMAPEQIERPLDVDHRADIYSLGVVFYQMLTGELPLGRFDLPSRKVTIDVRLDEVVLRALEKSPEQRYQQATALKTEVERIGKEVLGDGLPCKPADIHRVVRKTAFMLYAYHGLCFALLGMTAVAVVQRQILSATVAVGSNTVREAIAKAASNTMPYLQVSFIPITLSTLVGLWGAYCFHHRLSYRWAIVSATVPLALPPFTFVSFPCFVVSIFALWVGSRRNVQSTFAGLKVRNSTEAWIVPASITFLLVAGGACGTYTLASLTDYLPYTPRFNLARRFGLPFIGPSVGAVFGTLGFLVSRRWRRRVKGLATPAGSARGIWIFSSAAVLFWVLLATYLAIRFPYPYR